MPQAKRAEAARIQAIREAGPSGQGLDQRGFDHGLQLVFVLQGTREMLQWPPRAAEVGEDRDAGEPLQLQCLRGVQVDAVDGVDSVPSNRTAASLRVPSSPSGPGRR
jgi:hypothetical protein